MVFIAVLKFKRDKQYTPEEYSVKVNIPKPFWNLLSFYRGEGREVGKIRVSYYVINAMKKRLASSPSPKKEELTFNEELGVDEIDELTKIDPNEVNLQEEVIIEEVKIGTQRIFISCGQRDENEKRLGRQIKQLIENNTSFDGYFAEYQNSLDGLTKNIFNALHESAAFIAILHRRDEITKGVYRGSVWIEQEIAIAAFMVQSLALSLPAKAYVQKGISREGVRGYIHLNPIEFDNEEEILENLRIWLPTLVADSIKR
jgi:CRISPR/Cas system CMR subunit Cmr4 (Cas7 group RAMP superfamily)